MKIKFIFYFILGVDYFKNINIIIKLFCYINIILYD